MNNQRSFQFPNHLIVHCCHHKTGTVWFLNILKKIASVCDVRFQACTQEELDPRTSIFLEDHSCINVSKLPLFRGSHMIRDPRDVIISGYFYHLWADEPWLHEPWDELSGASYQSYLRSKSEEEGLAAEIRFVGAQTIEDMIAWNYNQAEFIELRYEDMMTDDGKRFETLFRHYGFAESSLHILVELAAEFHFNNAAGRELGRVAERQHKRDGSLGQWKTRFTKSVKNDFKDKLGESLVKLGYEKDFSW